MQLYLPSTHMVEGGTRVSFDQTVAGPRLRHPGAVLNMTHLRLLSDRLPHPGVVLNRTCHHSISDRLPQTCKDDEHDPLWCGPLMFQTNNSVLQDIASKPWVLLLSLIFVSLLLDYKSIVCYFPGITQPDRRQR